MALKTVSCHRLGPEGLSCCKEPLKLSGTEPSQEERRQHTIGNMVSGDDTQTLLTPGCERVVEEQHCKSKDVLWDLFSACHCKCQRSRNLETAVWAELAPYKQKREFMSDSTVDNSSIK